MNGLEQIHGHLGEIRTLVDELNDRLALRDEYRIAFDLWAKAVADLKGWIRDEAVALNCPPNMVLAFGHRNHWRFRELEKRVNLFYSQMEEAREQCAIHGDEDWAAEQESIEFDVENA